MVRDESFRAILEVKFTLDQESPKFAEICPIKLVQLLDFCAWGRVRGRTMKGRSKAADSTCELRKGVVENLFTLVLIIIIVGVRKEVI